MLTTAAPARRPGPIPAGRQMVAPRRATSGLHPAAASTLTPAWLHGPPAPARVVAVFGAAAYVLRDEEILPVLAPGALALPGGVRLAAADHLEDLRLRVGDDVVAGGGRLLARGAGLVVRRAWRPRAVPSAPLPAPSRDRAHSALGALPGQEDLPADVVRLAPQVLGAARPRASLLVGLGPGLTPAGDDVLCGLLLGLRATGREAERARLERDVIPLLGRTTALSATLLRQAAAGYAVPPVVELLHAWHRADVPGPDLVRLAGEVAAVGHTSGRAILLGLSAALALSPTHPAREDRRE